MAGYVIRLVERVGIARVGSQAIPAGSWLERWDMDYAGGLGAAWWTVDPAKAHRFASPADAMAAWRSQSRLAPLRADGQPNRPLTAYTVEVIPAP